MASVGSVRFRGPEAGAKSRRPMRAGSHDLRVDLNHLNLRVRDPGACRDFYVRHFGFEPAFDADGGHFIRNGEGFLLALIPAEPHQTLPDGFHIGFGLRSADEVMRLHSGLAAAGVRASDVQDHRPGESYVTFRCWDPDDTEIEIFWED